ncbi:MAG: DNA-processing protein DprA [Alistipes sp.]|nr:DNA-processing protein DprA [Alistipes sp.]
MTIEDIALQMTSGIGPKGAVHLLQHFGDARAIFAASERELIEIAELRPALARPIAEKRGFRDAEKELDFCRRHDIRPIASTDPDYPALLREIPDRPHVLYTQGDVAALSRRCLSVVGTRSMSAYGLAQCTRLIEELARRVPQLCIVSGLAYGIDATAHRAALAAGIPTAAVLPESLANIVPAQHTALARDIAAHGGVLVSEIPSQHPRHGTGYMARNRIIAGLSAGCLVVEAAEKSGSLTTATFACGYDRSLLAVPGRVTDKHSRGTNLLIRDHKAQLVLSAEEIIRELMWDLEPGAVVSRPPIAAPALTEEERALLAHLPDSDPVSFDELASKTGIDASMLQTPPTLLEINDAIRTLPGNRYLKIR